MTMMNDNESFIREVNEELRSEQMPASGSVSRLSLSAARAVIVLGVAGSTAWQWWESKQSSASGDRFLTALKDAGDNNTANAEKELTALSKDGSEPIRLLARMRLATLKAEKGDTAGAVADFSAIGKDTSIPEPMRHVARLRAAWLLVDSGDYAKSRLKSRNSQPRLGHAPRRPRGARSGRLQIRRLRQARDWLQLIVDDADAPAGTASRARTLLALITASGKLS